MRRAGKRGISGLAVTLGMVGALALALLVWREAVHRRAAAALGEERAALREQLAQTETARDREAARADGAEAALAEARLVEQGLGDRVTNLEAQRDHLRAQAEHQAERLRQAEASLEGLQTGLESAREELLEAQALPDQLRAELDLARRVAADLEAALDGQASSRADLPALLAVAGVSADGSVFALDGALPVQEPLPAPVLVCRADRVILEGWINRVEEEALIGHVQRWRIPASALVKGEKVFILPHISHEADP